MYNKRYLQELCKKYNLPINGSMKQLVRRLLGCNEVEEKDKKITKFIGMTKKELFEEYGWLKKSDSKEIMIDKILNEKIPVKMFSVDTELSLEEINSRIEKEVCHHTLKELSDEKLLFEYEKSKSVKKALEKLEVVLSKYIDNETIKKNIKQDYLSEIIPPGTKGVIRGNHFNKIVKQFIKKIDLKKERFDVFFEKNCEGYFTTEIPDWYIFDKSLNKVIIGMNQLDLWGGGHQTNRGSKYIYVNNNNINIKLLCVVCNETKIKSGKSKLFNLFKVGFKNNTLCYLNNLQNIINLHFNLS